MIQTLHNGSRKPQSLSFSFVNRPQPYCLATCCSRSSSANTSFLRAGRISLPTTYIMSTYQAYHREDTEQQPVSPISPESEAIWSRQQYSAGPVSPQNEPRKSYPPASVFNIPKRKPVPASAQQAKQFRGSRSDVNTSSRPIQRNPTKAPARMQPTSQQTGDVTAMPRMSEQYFQDWQHPAPSNPKPSRSQSRRPRSQSFHHVQRKRSSSIIEMPTTIYLQDYQNHAGITEKKYEPPPIQPRVESNSSDSLEFYGRMRCYKCGIPETPNRKAFTKCGRCNIYWCGIKCYTGHKCEKTVYDRIPNRPPQARVPRTSPTGPAPSASQASRPARRHDAAYQSRPTHRLDVEAQQPGEDPGKHPSWKHALIWGIPIAVTCLICLILAVKFA